MRVYLDHAATTPVLKDVYDYMSPFFTKKFGNASSSHLFGKEAKEALESSRQRIASIINCYPDEIYFTSGGTEADNLSIFGLAEGLKEKKSIITCSIEHEAVIEPCQYLQSKGYTVKYIPVDENGIIDLKLLKEAITDDTLLISIMLANNEVGSIQPLKDIVSFAKEKGVYVHTDAVQAMGKMKVKIDDLGVDILSASSHKFYGPKGAGFLYIKRGTPIRPVVYGGGHERSLRSGTENVSGIAGMSEALRICYENFDENNDRFIKYKNMIIENFRDYEGFRLNQSIHNSLPNIINISFKGLNGESIAEMLSLYGIAVSNASACSSHHPDKDGRSRVIKAMGIDDEYSGSAIRISTGIDNDENQIQYFIDSLKKIISRLRSYSNGF